MGAANLLIERLDMVQEQFEDSDEWRQMVKLADLLVEHLEHPEVGRLALADGEEPELSPVERSRARKRLAEGLDTVVGRLGARADLQGFYAHSGVLDPLAGNRRVVRGGISAAAEHGAHLVASDEFEGYVR